MPVHERINVRQIPGEPKRRWFSSDDFDLIVWVADDQSFNGFELCYDKGNRERSISWRRAGGFRHMAVDDGEQRPGKHKASPVLIPDGYFDARQVHSALSAVSHMLPAEIAGYVLKALERYPQELAGRMLNDASDRR
jgi:hypothetical protein